MSPWHLGVKKYNPGSTDAQKVLLSFGEESQVQYDEIAPMPSLSVITRCYTEKEMQIVTALTFSSCEGVTCATLVVVAASSWVG